MQPTTQESGNDWHDDPSQRHDDARIEDSVLEDEGPGLNRRANSQIQHHREWKNSKERGHRHLPSWRRLRRAKPRFESVELTIDRLTFSQCSRSLLPRLEHW